MMLKRLMGNGQRYPYWILCVALVALVLLVTTCGNPNSSIPPSQSTAASSPSTTSAVAHVDMVAQGSLYVFEPATLTIKVGTKVIWTNRSHAPHTVSSDTGAFDTPDPAGITMGQMYAFTFTKPGTYSYYCNIHTYMAGKIVVTA